MCLRFLLPGLLALLLGACGPGGHEPVATPAAPAPQRVRALADEPFVPVSTAELLNWAEASFPTLFPGTQPDLPYGPYTYRHYPATGNYVGASNGSIYLMGPLAAQLGGHPRYLTEVLYYGEVATVTCQIQAARCGRKEAVQLSAGGLPRQFIVYVSWKARDSGQRVPAVVVLHGAGSGAEAMFDASGWREKADAEGLVVVFPDALAHCVPADTNGDGRIDNGEVDVRTRWNASPPGALPACSAEQLARTDPDTRARADHPPADDAAFMAAVLDHLNAWYLVDMKRVHLSGFDSGGELAGRLALQMPDRFAAFGVHAARLGAAAQGGARLPTVLFSVGSLDPDFSAALGHPQGLPLDASLGAEADFRALVASPWIGALQLSATPVWTGPSIGGVRTSRFDYSPTSGAATHRFSAHVIEGAAHAYPNGSNHPLKLADLLWDGFKAEALP